LRENKKPLLPGVLEQLNIKRQETTVWRDYENDALIKAVLKYGKDFDKLGECVTLRTTHAIRTHLWDLKQKLGKESELSEEN